MADTTDQARKHSTDPVADLTSVPETGRTLDRSSVADAPHEHAADGRDGGYRGPQVCKIVGITYRQLDYWARTDLVRPSITDAKGSGTQRTYSFQDLVRLKVVKSLLDAGVKLQTARQAIDYLREDLGDDWASANLVLDGTNMILVRTDDMLIDVVRRGQGVLNIVPLAHVMEELDAGVREHVAELRAASGG
jgi:DNA-binding transcriptional MerR regulator